MHSSPPSVAVPGFEGQLPALQPPVGVRTPGPTCEAVCLSVSPCLQSSRRATGRGWG